MIAATIRASPFFVRILLTRLFILEEDVLPKSQCGFRYTRGTIDMRQNRQEQQQPVMFW